MTFFHHWVLGSRKSVEWFANGVTSDWLASSDSPTLTNQLLLVFVGFKPFYDPKPMDSSKHPINSGCVVLGSVYVAFCRRYHRYIGAVACGPPT